MCCYGNMYLHVFVADLIEAIHEDIRQAQEKMADPKNSKYKIDGFFEDSTPSS